MKKITMLRVYVLKILQMCLFVPLPLNLNAQTIWGEIYPTKKSQSLEGEYGGKPIKELPKLKVGWNPHFEDKFIELSLVNTGTQRVELCVKPLYRYVETGGIKPEGEIPEPANKNNTVFALVVFSAVSNGIISNSFANVFSGPEPGSIKIDPGETKIVKFEMDDKFVTLSKRTSSVTFSLLWNGKNFDEITMQDVGGKLRKAAQ